jgi:hypothetical protein
MLLSSRELEVRQEEYSMIASRDVQLIGSVRHNGLAWIANLAVRWDGRVVQGELRMSFHQENEVWAKAVRMLGGNYTERIREEIMLNWARRESLAKKYEQLIEPAVHSAGSVRFDDVEATLPQAQCLLLDWKRAGANWG